MDWKTSHWANYTGHLSSIWDHLCHQTLSLCVKLESPPPPPHSMLMTQMLSFWALKACGLNRTSHPMCLCLKAVCLSSMFSTSVGNLSQFILLLDTGHGRDITHHKTTWEPLPCFSFWKKRGILWNGQNMSKPLLTLAQDCVVPKNPAASDLTFPTTSGPKTVRARTSASSTHTVWPSVTLGGTTGSLHPQCTTLASAWVTVHGSCTMDTTRLTMLLSRPSSVSSVLLIFLCHPVCPTNTNLLVCWWWKRMATLSIKNMKTWLQNLVPVDDCGFEMQLDVE